MRAPTKGARRGTVRDNFFARLLTVPGAVWTPDVRTLLPLTSFCCHDTVGVILSEKVESLPLKSCLKRYLKTIFVGFLCTLAGCAKKVEPEANEFISVSNCKSQQVGNEDVTVLRVFNDNLRALQIEPEQILVESNFEDCYFQVVSNNGVPIRLLSPEETRAARMDANFSLEPLWKLKDAFDPAALTDERREFYVNRLAQLETELKSNSLMVPGWFDLALPSEVLDGQLTAVFGVAAAEDGAVLGMVALFHTKVASVD